MEGRTDGGREGGTELCYTDAHLQPSGNVSSPSVCHTHTHTHGSASCSWAFCFYVPAHTLGGAVLHGGLMELSCLHTDRLLRGGEHVHSDLLGDFLFRAGSV